MHFFYIKTLGINPFNQRNIKYNVGDLASLFPSHGVIPNHFFPQSSLMDITVGTQRSREDWNPG